MSKFPTHLTNASQSQEPSLQKSSSLKEDLCNTSSTFYQTSSSKTIASPKPFQRKPSFKVLDKREKTAKESLKVTDLKDHFCYISPQKNVISKNHSSFQEFAEPVSQKNKLRASILKTQQNLSQTIHSVSQDRLIGNSTGKSIFYPKQQKQSQNLSNRSSYLDCSFDKGCIPKKAMLPPKLTFGEQPAEILDEININLEKNNTCRTELPYERSRVQRKSKNNVVLTQGNEKENNLSSQRTKDQETRQQAYFTRRTISSRTLKCPSFSRRESTNLEGDPDQSMPRSQFGSKFGPFQNFGDQYPETKSEEESNEQTKEWSKLRNQNSQLLEEVRQLKISIQTLSRQKNQLEESSKLFLQEIKQLQSAETIKPESYNEVLREKEALSQKIANLQSKLKKSEQHKKQNEEVYLFELEACHEQIRALKESLKYLSIECDSLRRNSDLLLTTEKQKLLAESKSKKLERQVEYLRKQIAQMEKEQRQRPKSHVRAQSTTSDSVIVPHKTLQESLNSADRKNNIMYRKDCPFNQKSCKNTLNQELNQQLLFELSPDKF